MKHTETAMDASKMDTISGYYPGVLGRVIEVHGEYYHRYWGFDRSFEIQVAGELADFMAHFDDARDGFWVARAGETFAGCIALDGRLQETQGARIRWFIVHPNFQGKGLGGGLLRKAVAYWTSEKSRRKMFLWTFQGLDAAKRLYEREGFHLVEEKPLCHWGTTILDQKYERPAGPAAN
jgi:GNAT superfamily N-acetyltransferase